VETAQQAVRKLNQRDLSGRSLRVEQVTRIDPAAKKVQQPIQEKKDQPDEPKPIGSKTVHVGNVPSHINLGELGALLSESGSVALGAVSVGWLSPHLVNAVFPTEAAATLAVRILQAQYFHGRNLSLSIVPPPKEKKRPAENVLEGPKPKKMHFEDAVVLMDIEGSDNIAPVRWFPQKCGSELVRGTIEDAIRKHRTSRHARDVLRYLFEQDTDACADPKDLPDCLRNLTDGELGIEPAPDIIILNSLAEDFEKK
jgi:RNA recognition motif-containing protein